MSNYKPCHYYTIEITSSSDYGHAFSVSDGEVQDLHPNDPDTNEIDTKCRGENTQSTSKYIFIAPDSSINSVTLSAICGNYDTMYVAPKITLTLDATAETKAVCTPTSAPTLSPTIQPTAPTPSPTKAPTYHPTPGPSKTPTTQKPTISPTESPTFNPTPGPSKTPTTRKPTSGPTKAPSFSPTNKPTSKPTTKPTTSPSDKCSALSEKKCKKDSDCIFLKDKGNKICIPFACSALSKSSCKDFKKICDWDKTTKTCKTK